MRRGVYADLLSVRRRCVHRGEGSSGAAGSDRGVGGRRRARGVPGLPCRCDGRSRPARQAPQHRGAARGHQQRGRARSSTAGGRAHPCPPRRGPQPQARHRDVLERVRPLHAHLFPPLALASIQRLRAILVVTQTNANERMRPCSLQARLACLLAMLGLADLRVTARATLSSAAARARHEGGPPIRS